MLEIAANIVLPDNGIHWHKLRSGDLTEAGRLSSGDLSRHGGRTIGSSSDLDLESDVSGSPKVPPVDTFTTSSSSCSSHFPIWAPRFMIDNSQALDRMVRWLLDPTPTNRPTAHQILMTEEAQWVEAHRKAGAIIYEGDFGPEPLPDSGSIDDVEMIMMRDDEDINWRRQ